MLSRVPASFRALRSPARVSSHSARIFQKRCPCSITGWLGKRYTSSRLICRPSKRASSTRPLLAPRSTAAIVRVATHLPLSQRGYAAATPPSTLRMLPVLLVERVGEAKNATASAISSDRKSTRLNSSHTVISYAVFCLKKKNNDVMRAHARHLHEHDHR